MEKNMQTVRKTTSAKRNSGPQHQTPQETTKKHQKFTKDSNTAELQTDKVIKFILSGVSLSAILLELLTIPYKLELSFIWQWNGVPCS